MSDENVPTIYPFAAIVGQELMRLALLLNAIDPRIGGVLIRGEKGTAKSTMARALADLLPEQRILAGCAYGCDPDGAERCDVHRTAGTDAPVAVRQMPVIDLPMNATEDRVAGTLDVRAALSGGGFRFEPGLLAAAHRGVLYVDEVNLLPDHIVDLVLDAAAMGWNKVEREGVSLTHPARFILIGTMNPEEGELRPQLQDRFGLCVQVAGIATIDERVEVMRRREAYDADPAAFALAWTPEQDTLRHRVQHARRLLQAIEPPDEILRLIAAVSLELGVDGHRADLVMLRAARALAAFDGRAVITRDDVRRAAGLAVPHRMRRRPFEQERYSDQRVDAALERTEAGEVREEESGAGGDDRGTQTRLPGAAGLGGSGVREEMATPVEAPTSTLPALPSLLTDRDLGARGERGRRLHASGGEAHGRSVRSAPLAGDGSSIAVAATVRTAAARRSRAGEPIGRELALAVHQDDVRSHVREHVVGATIIFLVDLSGSMRAKRRLEAARGSALTLLSEAYQRRDRVALIAFRGRGADVVLPPTSSVELAQRLIGELPVGGRTPLAAGLRAGLELLRQVRLKDPRAVCVPVLLTDGKANATGDGQPPVESALEAARGYLQPGVHPLVLDTEDGAVRLGLAARVAEQAGARYVRLSDLSLEAVAAETRAEVSAASGVRQA